MTDSSTIPVPPTSIWQWLDSQPSGATYHIHRAMSLAAVVRRALSDEAPIRHGEDSFHIENCVQILCEELDVSLQWLEDNLEKFPMPQA